MFFCIPGIQYVEYADYADSGKTEGGRLWATWYSGESGETGRNYVILVTSDDGGETWSDARAIIDPDDVGPVRVFDSVLWTDPNGKMWIFWNQEYDYLRFDGKKGVWGIYKENHYEQDPTWSEPVRLCNGVMMNKPTVIKDENGADAWILSAYLLYTYETTDVKEIGPNLYKFTDYGKSWDKFAYINADGTIIPDSILEHMLVQNTDGSLRVIVRTPGGIVDVVSTDYGKSWSGGQLMTNANVPS